MKRRFLLALIFIFVLSGGTVAMAHGGMNHDSSGNMQGMDMNGKDKNMDMKGMDMTGKDKNMDMSGSSNDMPGMNMGGDEVVKETPPNVKVLGTYGVVNLAFIFIGIWNKWFRRKDGSNGNS